MELTEVDKYSQIYCVCSTLLKLDKNIVNISVLFSDALKMVENLKQAYNDVWNLAPQYAEMLMVMIIRKL